MLSSADRSQGSDIRQTSPRRDKGSRGDRQVLKSGQTGGASPESAPITRAARKTRTDRATGRKRKCSRKVDAQLHAVQPERLPDVSLRACWRRHNQIRGSSHQNEENCPHDGEKPPRRRERRLVQRGKIVHAAARQKGGKPARSERNRRTEGKCPEFRPAFGKQTDHRPKDHFYITFTPYSMEKRNNLCIPGHHRQRQKREAYASLFVMRPSSGRCGNRGAAPGESGAGGRPLKTGATMC